MPRVIEYKVGNLYEIESHCILKCTACGDDGLGACGDDGLGMPQVIIEPVEPVNGFQLRIGAKGYWKPSGCLNSFSDGRLPILKEIEP